MPMIICLVILNLYWLASHSRLAEEQEMIVPPGMVSVAPVIIDPIPSQLALSAFD